jgi:acyl dehydratase
MAPDPSRAGHRYPDTEPYEVTRVKIREFAEAIGDPSPLYRDLAAARAAGHRDIPAPPTLAVIISQPASRQASSDPAVGIDYSRVVHGEQRFVHHLPLCAGDTVTARVEIVDIRPAGGNWLLSTRTELRRIDDDVVVCTATSTLVERGAPG